MGGIGLRELRAGPGVCREQPQWEARLPLLDTLMRDTLQQGGQSHTETPNWFGLQTSTPSLPTQIPGVV